jgi:hypothetical protein
VGADVLKRNPRRNSSIPHYAESQGDSNFKKGGNHEIWLEVSPSLDI